VPKRPGFLTVSEAARLLGVSTATILYAVAHMRLPAHCLGCGHQLSRSVILRYPGARHACETTPTWGARYRLVLPRDKVRAYRVNPVKQRAGRERHVG
jgi:excisionase family DNA binding protein